MTLPTSIKKALTNPEKLGPFDLWRNLPTRAPAVDIFYPSVFSSDQQARLAAFEASVSGIDHDRQPKDRWRQYAISPGTAESLDFCFDDVKITHSRFTDGTHPAWYGALTEDTSRLETAYHIKRQLMHELAASKKRQAGSIQRCMYKAKVYLAAGADLRPFIKSEPRILEEGPPYPFCNEIAAAAVSSGIEGMHTKSKRSSEGECVVVFAKACIKDSKARNQYTVTVQHDGKVFIMGDQVNL